MSYLKKLKAWLEKETVQYYGLILSIMFLGLWVFTVFTMGGVISLRDKEINDLTAQVLELQAMVSESDREVDDILTIVRYANELELEEYEKEQETNEQETIDMLAKTVWGEARGCSDTQKAAVVWCILNRVDSDRFPNDIKSVITQKNQFEGYNNSFPVEEEIVAIVKDVLWRYEYEKNGPFVGYSGRVLPKEYLFFRASGDGVNVFRTEYLAKDSVYWDWAWGTPYKD